MRRIVTLPQGRGSAVARYRSGHRSHIMVGAVWLSACICFQSMSAITLSVDIRPITCCKVITYLKSNTFRSDSKENMFLVSVQQLPGYRNSINILTLGFRWFNISATYKLCAKKVKQALGKSSGAVDFTAMVSKSMAMHAGRYVIMGQILKLLP